MAVTSSGEIKFSDLAAEFGDDPPYQLSEFYRGAGKVPDVNDNVPASGQLRLAQFYGSVNELLQTVTANASINAQTIFGSDWGTNIPKRLSIPSGVTIGPLTIPTGMGGTLEVDVAGEIQGLGGSAGSAGGNAITASTSFTLNVLSGGAVRGGGGGGGTGGAGGNGSVTVQRTHGYQSQYMGMEHQGGNLTHSWFYGSYKATGGIVNSVNYGSTTIYIIGGSASGYSIGWNETSSTTGGAGGAGGVGRGYNQTLASGSVGSAGGTNAGTGGTGGNGGDWATAGSTGAAGANGNSTNGVAGSAGGAAGAAVLMNAGTVTVNNSGTINGAY